MAGLTTGPMAGKTVLVTGGTGGIGKATAIGPAAAGTRSASPAARSPGLGSPRLTSLPRPLPPRFLSGDVRNPRPPSDDPVRALSKSRQPRRIRWRPSTIVLSRRSRRPHVLPLE
jgi:NAD(P)-dependent dehydrogenase (short-subunit alcohol dehydrogenase family)